MIKTIVVIAVIGFFIILGLMIFFSFQGPNLQALKQKYDYLKEPQIKTMPVQKMLQLEVKGDPNKTAGKAFTQLFNTYYKLKKKVKDLPVVASRVRWLQSANTAKNEWTGVFGIPIPDSVEALPEGSGDVKIAIWEYGAVAEIVHTGAYDQENPTIDKLTEFLKGRGYQITGPHEEEYLKGPGMLFKGNPKDYYTIIRYQVKKK